MAEHAGELPHEARLAEARLADQGHDLSGAAAGALDRAAEQLQLRTATDEGRESASRARVHARPCRQRRGDLVGVQRLGHASHSDRTHRFGLDVTLREGERARRD